MGASHESACFCFQVDLDHIRGPNFHRHMVTGGYRPMGQGFTMDYKLGDRYYILEGRTPVRCSDLEALDRCLCDAESRRVALTHFAGVSVSTVFLCIDHNWNHDGPPILFETSIFGGPHDGWFQRYATWEEADAGHARALDMIGASH
jgi:hypothetical protein